MRLKNIRKSAERLNQNISHELIFQGEQDIKNMCLSGEWKIGEEKELGDFKNPFKLIEVNPNGAIFEGECIHFGPHLHPLETEIITVKSGVLKDYLVLGEWTAGQICIYEPMNSHEPYNPDPSTPLIISVRFLWDA